jgi:hypothetical protein
LRKARRLDEVVSAPRFDAVPALHPSSELPLDNQCIYCSTEFSPYWWPADALSGGSIDALTHSMDEDVKMANGDTPQPSNNGAADADVILVENTDENADPMEITRKSLHRKICHACYFQRSQEQDKPIVVDLSTTPIVVV